jgi:hypothetical protein
LRFFFDTTVESVGVSGLFPASVISCLVVAFLRLSWVGRPVARIWRDFIGPLRAIGQQQSVRSLRVFSP